MRRIVLVLSVLVVCFCSFGFSLDLSADAFILKDFIMRSPDYQGGISASLMLDGDFQIRVPLTVTYKANSVCFEGALKVSYYPFSKGLFLSISMLDMAYVYNMRDKSAKQYTLNEIEAGWTFFIGKRFFIEPSVCVRDPSGTFVDEYEELRGMFKSYSKIKIRLLCGYRLFEEAQK